MMKKLVSCLWLQMCADMCSCLDALSRHFLEKSLTFVEPSSRLIGTAVTAGIHR